MNLHSNHKIAARHLKPLGWKSAELVYVLARRPAAAATATTNWDSRLISSGMCDRFSA